MGRFPFVAAEILSNGGQRLSNALIMGGEPEEEKKEEVPPKESSKEESPKDEENDVQKSIVKVIADPNLP